MSTAWILTPLAAIGLYLAARSWQRRRGAWEAEHFAEWEREIASERSDQP